MGAVYLAVHEATGARRALKVLTLGPDAEAQARFLREGEAMARVDGHPNVVRVHGAGSEGGHLFLALELVEGGDLGRRLQREGPLAPRDAAELVRTLAGAVAHLHARGVLHRDLKPANVLLGADGAPRLADFGLARLADAQRLTRTGGLLGSPGYMAPEQVEDAGAVDVRCDVYGLGALLYGALTGQAPFGADGRGVTYVLRQVLLHPPPPPSSLVPGLPRALEALCLRCLEKEPARRPPTARALADALGAWLSGELPEPRGGRWALALAAVAGAVVVGAAWLVRRSPATVVEPVAPVATDTTATKAAKEAGVRAEYLRLCHTALSSDQLQRLTDLAAALDHAALDELGREKAAGVAALVSAEAQALRGQLRPPGPAVETLRRLEQLLRAPPEVEAPPGLVALLDEALAGWLRRPVASQADVDEVCAAELRRAHLVDHRRPPDALGLWLVTHQRSNAPLSLVQLRVSLWADLKGIVETISYLSPELRGFGPEELARARDLEPDSQALALLELGARVDAADTRKPSDPPRELLWTAAVVAGRRAVAERPQPDLGPRWLLRARWLTCKALFHLRHGFMDPTADGPALAEELLTVAAAARAGEARLELRPLEELAGWEAGARLRLGRVGEARAGWEATVAEARPALLGEQRNVALGVLHGASTFFAEGVQDFGRAFELGLEEHRYAQTPQERRRAVRAALRATRELPLDDPRQATLEALLPADPSEWIVAWSESPELAADEQGSIQFAAELVRRRVRQGDQPGAIAALRQAQACEVSSGLERATLPAWLLEAVSGH